MNRNIHFPRTSRTALILLLATLLLATAAQTASAVKNFRNLNYIIITFICRYFKYSS